MRGELMMREAYDLLHQSRGDRDRYTREALDRLKRAYIRAGHVEKARALGADIQ